jgi:hypothetical protein
MAQQDGYIGHRDPLQQQFNGEGIAPSVGVSVLDPGIARQFAIGNPLTFLNSFLPSSDQLLVFEKPCSFNAARSPQPRTRNTCQTTAKCINLPSRSQSQPISATAANFFALLSPHEGHSIWERYPIEKRGEGK